MQYIITRVESTEGRFVEWHVRQMGNYYNILLTLKDQDLKDLLRQISEQDVNIKFQISNIKL